MNADFQRRVEENSDWNETSYTRVKDEVLALLREEVISKDEAKQLIETLDLVSSIKLRQEFTNQLKQNRLSAEEYIEQLFANSKDTDRTRLAKLHMKEFLVGKIPQTPKRELLPKIPLRGTPKSSHTDTLETDVDLGDL